MPYVAKLSGGCTADPAISVGLQGGDGIWSTTVANWNTAADGSGQRVAWTNGDDAIISAGNTGTITISGGVTANSVTFTNGGYTVNGSTLALTGTRAIVSNGDSSNYTIVCSEIMSDVTFNGNAVYRGNGNEGIFGNATFNDSSVNQGTITGNATFNGSSFNDYGPISGNVTFNDSSYNNGTISGDATFNGFSYNIWGTINGDATFNGFSYNNWGTINGDATFNTAWYDPTGNTAPSDGVFVVSGSQYWYGSVSGTVYGIDGQAITSYVFDDSSYNYGTISGNATFGDWSYNYGTITGNATFNGSSYNYYGTITGDATFNNSSFNQGTITGNAFFTSSSFDSNSGIFSADPTGLSSGGSIGGAVTFTSTTPVTFTLHNWNWWYVDTSNWVFNSVGQNWVFTGSSANAGTVTGDATFNDSSYNGGTISGNAAFNNSSYNNWGTIGGNATFNTTWYDPTGNTAPSNGIFVLSGTQYWSGSVSGTVYGADGQMITSYVFNDSSCNALGTISGDATFNDSAFNQMGVISGNAFFTASSFDSNGGIPNADPTGLSSGSSIGGVVTFTSTTPVTFTLRNSDLWNEDTSNWVFSSPGENWVFTGNSANIGTVVGNATLNDSSYNNYGTIVGNATFNTTWYDPTGNTAPSNGVFVISGGQYWGGSVSGTVYGSDGQAITSYVVDDSSSNYGTISGNATFNNSSCNGGTISGDATFDDQSVNYGTVVFEGNVDVSGRTFSSGTYQVASGATVLNSGGLTINGATFVNDGTLIWNTNDLSQLANITNNGTVIFEADVNLSGLTLFGAGTYEIASGVTATSSGGLVLDGSSLENLGTFDLLAGTLSLSGGAKVINDGTLKWAGDASGLGTAEHLTIRGSVLDSDGGTWGSGLANGSLVVEGSDETASFTILHPSASDTALAFHYSYALDPANLASIYAAATDSTSKDFTFADNGVYTVYGRVWGNDGEYSDYAATVTVHNVALTVTTDPANVNAEGQQLHFTSTVTDPGINDGFTYVWSVTRQGDPSYVCDDITDAQELYFTPPDHGTYHISLTVTDKDGASGTATTDVTVDNVAPTGQLTNSGAALEGSPIAVSFTDVSDPSSADTSAGFHYSYALSPDALADSYASAADDVSRAFTFATRGNYTIYGRIFDQDGAFVDDQTFITVSVPGPTAIALSSSSISETAVPGTIVATLSAADLSSSTITYALVTGNGSDDNASFNLAEGTNQLTLADGVSLNFATKDTYSIRLRATDANSATWEQSFTINITQGNSAPTILNTTSDSYSISGTTANLHVDASDDTDEANLTYGWSVVDSPNVAFSVNNANAAKNTTVTFNQAGTYTFQVTVTDGGGLVATDTLTLTVDSTPTNITINAVTAEGSPVTANPVVVEDGATQQFTATAYDQFGQVISDANLGWGYDWSITGSSAVGTIDYDGLYTAPDTGSGNLTVMASSGGITGTANFTLAVPQVSAPATSLTAAASSAYQINLSWTDHGSNETGYVVEQATDPAFTQNLQSYDLDAHSTSFTATTDILSNVTYYFRVRALNAGGASDNSNVATVTTSLVPQVPNIPTNLTITGRQANQINLAWADVSANSYGVDESSYLLERATNADFSQNLTQITLYQDTTTCSDTALQAGVTYYYRLRAVSSSGWSDPSNSVSATAPAAAEIPTIATPAGASATVVTTTSTTLSVLGADDGGEENLTYNWSVVSSPDGAPAPAFSANASHAAASTSVTFAQAGNYSFLVTITDATGLGITSSISIQVSQTLTSIVVTPDTSTISAGTTQPFVAAAQDQFGNAMLTPPQFTWSVTSGDGSVTGAGLYTAPASATGSATIRASSAGINGQATLDYAPANVAMADTDVVQAMDTTLALYVLANDIPPTGATLSIISITAGSHGTVAIVHPTNGDPDYLSYSPVTGFTGFDTFSYTVEDSVNHQTYTAPIHLHISAGSGGLISSGSLAGTLHYQLNTFYTVDPASAFADVASGNYSFIKISPTSTTTTSWTDSSGILHSVLTTINRTLTVYSTLSLLGGWNYDEDLTQTTTIITDPASGTTGTHQNETIIDNYDLDALGNAQTFGYSFTGTRSDNLAGSTAGPTELIQTLSGHKTAFFANSVDTGTGSVSVITSDQHGDTAYSDHGLGTYSYNTSGGQVTGTTDQTSGWEDSYSYLSGSGSYIYGQSNDWTYSGSGSFNDGSNSGVIDEGGASGSSSTYTIISQMTGSTLTRTGTGIGGDSSGGHWSSTGGGVYTQTSADTAGTSSISGTTGITHSTTWGSNNNWGMTLDGSGNWGTTSGSGDSTGATTDNWSYAGGGSYTNVAGGITTDHPGTITQSQNSGSTTDYSIHSSWAGNSWTQTGVNHSSDSTTGDWTSSGTGTYTHLSTSATGSSSVSGNTSVTHGVHWGSDNSLALTLGTNGSWTVSSGSGDSTGTTIDNWGYSGAGTTTSSSSSTGQVPTVGVSIGTFTNTGSSSGNITESESDGVTTGYSIHSNWNDGSWVNTGSNTYNNSVTGHWGSTLAGTYSHITDTSTDSNSSGTVVNSPSHSTITGNTGATHTLDWGSRGSMTLTLGTGGNWSVSSGDLTYTGSTTDRWNYSGGGNPTSSSTTTMPLPGNTSTSLSVVAGSSTYSGSDQGTVVEGETNTAASSYSIHSSWNGTKWTATGKNSATTFDQASYTASSTGTYTQTSNTSTNSDISGTQSSSDSHSTVTNSTTFTHALDWGSSGSVTQTIGTNGAWTTSSGDLSYNGNTRDNGTAGSRGNTSGSDSTVGQSNSGANHGTIVSDSTNTYSLTYAQRSHWTGKSWKDTGSNTASTLDNGSFSSSSTGTYTHSSSSTDISDTSDTLAASADSSTVTGPTGSTHSITWDSHGNTVQGLTTPAPTSANPTPSARWSTTGGTMFYSGTTTDNWFYNGSGTSTGSDDTLGPVGSTDTYYNRGDSTGTITEEGTNTSSYHYDITSKWQNQRWQNSGSDTAGTLDSGSYFSSSTGTYTHTTTGSSGSSVTGNAYVTHSSDWNTTGTTVQTLGANGNWSVSSGNFDSTGSTEDTWNYAGDGTFPTTQTSGTINEWGDNDYYTTYSIHNGWNNGQWNKTGKEFGFTSDSGGWTASATATYAHGVTDVPGATVSGSTGASKTNDWDKYGEVTMMLSTPAATSANPTPTATWTMQDGWGQSDGTSVDGWTYSGVGTYSNTQGTGTINENGSNASITHNSIDTTWGIGATAWTKTGNQTQTSVDSGGWTQTGSGTYTYTPPSGVTLTDFDGTTDLTRSNAWSWGSTLGQTWDANAGTTGAWVTNSDVTHGSVSSFSSNSSSAAGEYDRTLADNASQTCTGTASQDTLIATSSSYTWNATRGSGGSYSYSGSGHAQTSSDSSLSLDGGGTGQWATTVTAVIYNEAGDAQLQTDEGSYHYTENAQVSQSSATDSDWTLGPDGSWVAAGTTEMSEGTSHFDVDFGWGVTSSAYDHYVSDGHNNYQSYEEHNQIWQVHGDYAFTSDRTIDAAGQASGTGSGGGTAGGEYRHAWKSGPSQQPVPYFAMCETYQYCENWSQDYAAGSDGFSGVNTGALTVIPYADAQGTVLPGYEDSAQVVNSYEGTAPGFQAEAGPAVGYGPTLSVPGAGFGYNTSTPCFAAGTQVVGQDASGNAVDKNIEDIQVGDKVLTRDQNHPDAPLEYRTVTNVEVHTVKSLRLLTITQPDGTTETLRTTDNHPFWVKDDTQAEGGRWEEAKDLQVGDQLRTSDDHWVTLSGTTAEAHPEGITVYNLTVDGDHTYFVAAATGEEAIWVHNDQTTTGNPTNVKAGHGGTHATTKLTIPSYSFQVVSGNNLCHQMLRDMRSNGDSTAQSWPTWLPLPSRIPISIGPVVGPTGSFLVAIGGTDSGNSAPGSIFYFFKDYPGSKYYHQGPYNTITGGDSVSIETPLLNQILLYHSAHPNDPIDIIGHSRGGMIAVDLANQLKALGITVRFLGLYDPVDMNLSLTQRSFQEDIGWNVNAAAVARRDPTVLSRQTWHNVSAKPQYPSTDFAEATFMGSHGGVAGNGWGDPVGGTGIWGYLFSGGQWILEPRVKYFQTYVNKLNGKTETDAAISADEFIRRKARKAGVLIAIPDDTTYRFRYRTLNETFEAMSKLQKELVWENAQQ